MVVQLLFCLLGISWNEIELQLGKTTTKAVTVNTNSFLSPHFRGN